MKKTFVVLISFLTAFVSLRAQSPCAWTFSAKKTAGQTYEIHCTVDVNAPWHTYSQFTPDGGPVATKFTFSKNPLYSLEGPVKEEGKMITRHEAVFGVDVKYFEGHVDFVQLVKLKGNTKTNFSGSVLFMVCNDTECLPPATKTFSLILN